MPLPATRTASTARPRWRGAVIGPGILSGIPAGRAEQALDDNDARGFFASLNAQVVIGLTLTNVNNFRAILIS
jgi:glycerate-2-kinase